MNIQPTLAQFKTLAQSGNTLPVYLDLTADCETPLRAYAQISQSKPAFLFESIVEVKISVATLFWDQSA